MGKMGMMISWMLCPYAPCMVYFTYIWVIYVGQMLVNIPYMEHMGWGEYGNNMEIICEEYVERLD